MPYSAQGKDEGFAMAGNETASIETDVQDKWAAPFVFAVVS